MPSTAAATWSVSEAKSDVPSLAANDNKPELEKTTMAHAACLKKVLKAKMRSGPSEDKTVPPSQQRPKLCLRKKRTSMSAATFTLSMFMIAV